MMNAFFSEVLKGAVDDSLPGLGGNVIDIYSSYDDKICKLISTFIAR